MFDYHKEPYSTSPVDEIIWEKLIEYGRTGCPMGDFLEAVVRNDLAEAVLRADRVNRKHMYEILLFVYNELPAPCHGSPEEVSAWRTRRASKGDLRE